MKDSVYESIPEYKEIPEFDFSKNEPAFVFGEYRWILTCNMFPEQYEVFYKTKCVGYARLRAGKFRLSNHSLENLYTVIWSGKEKKGYFESEEERKDVVRMAQSILSDFYEGENLE